MSRGVPSKKALDAALPVARVRGDLMFIREDPATPFSILISGPGGGSAVSIRRARRIHGTLTEIAARYAEPLSQVSAAVLAPGIAREFWLWSPYGTLRFFRVEGTRLVELDRLGVPRGPEAVGLVSRKRRSRRRGTAPQADRPASGAAGGGGSSGSSGIPGTPAPDSAPGSAPGREPPAIRYLRHRAKNLRSSSSPSPGPGTGSPGNDPPPAIAGSPGSVGGVPP